MRRDAGGAGAPTGISVRSCSCSTRSLSGCGWRLGGSKPAPGKGSTQCVLRRGFVYYAVADTVHSTAAYEAAAGYERAPLH
jgi:hypothetical protein